MSDNRLAPSPGDADYVHLRALAVQLRRAIERHLGGRRDLRVLDVGSAGKPYAALFAERAAEHVGLDIAPGPGVDVVGDWNALPFDDARFDCVLATQSLQYADDPTGAVAEVARVLAPGGVALVSTHGVSAFDGAPTDRHRWTHRGLHDLFATAATWARIDVIPNGGPGTALAYLAGWELQGVGAILGRPGLVRPAIFCGHVAGWSVDRLLRRVKPGEPPDFSANYLVVAVRRPG